MTGTDPQPGGSGADEYAEWLKAGNARMSSLGHPGEDLVAGGSGAGSTVTQRCPCTKSDFRPQHKSALEWATHDAMETAYERDQLRADLEAARTENHGLLLDLDITERVRVETLAALEAAQREIELWKGNYATLRSSVAVLQKDHDELETDLAQARARIAKLEDVLRDASGLFAVEATRFPELRSRIQNALDAAQAAGASAEPQHASAANDDGQDARQ